MREGRITHLILGAMVANTWEIYLHIPTENNNEAIKLILLPNTPSKLVALLKSRNNRITLLSF